VELGFGHHLPRIRAREGAQDGEGKQEAGEHLVGVGVRGVSENAPLDGLPSLYTAPAYLCYRNRKHG
jgi:hypothetical protein